MHITELTDLDYAGTGLQSHKLYLAIPESTSKITPGASTDGTAPAPHPLIVYIHGGGWVGGNFDAGATGLATGRADTEAFLKAGYAVAVINYRLSTEARWPAQIHDCKAAIRFLRAHASDWNIDPNRIVAWGASAGAHLAQFLGFTNGNEHYDNRSIGYDTATRNASSDVNVVIAAFGISNIATWSTSDAYWHDMVEYYKDTILGADRTAAEEADASPIAHVTTSPSLAETMPPMLLAHADDDPVVPAQQTRALECRLREAGLSEHIETWYPETGGHGDPEVWRSPKATTRFIGFCNAHLG
ncbi:alpha/beta hydrolase [Bifidobacterium goeldii]|uniref:Alpha/beta hydrolase n=1 Tax=Bifidobacterium goeldii TaxID=2306975 RepID=A0A430FH71_9BIFI|nr:alpha/beta hydrolase [Bifidobacterium goeldii]RSX52196.1 alpha/beta hydrolase [Bifidobacterium goeldii]